MHRVISKWRFLVPVVALVAVAAFFLGGGMTRHDAAEASPDVYDSSSVTCTDVYLGQLPQDQPYPPKLPALGDPPVEAEVDPINYPGLFLPWPVANSLSYTDHLSNNDLGGSGATHIIGIPDLIAGSSRALTNCAEIAKPVATVSGSSGTDPVTVSYSDDDGGNPLTVGMLVYSTYPAHSAAPWFQVASANGSSATLKHTVATCNGTESASTSNKLYACEAVSPGKGMDLYAHNNPSVVKGGILNPAVQPRDPAAGRECPTCGHYYSKGTPSVSVDISCTPGTGPSEIPEDPVGGWTRIEIRVVVDETVNSKVPTWGLSQYYYPVTPKTCLDLPETGRSNSALVVWGLDSAEVEGDIGNWDSDWDNDGCLDWREMDYPLPTYQTTGTGNWTGGRDPHNPFDCGRDLTGIWSVETTVVPTTLGPNKSDHTNIVPGAYYHCRAAMDHNTGDDSIDAAVFCYIDIPGVPVNPEAGLDSGDGLGGYVYPIGNTGMPPAPFADVDDVQTHLSGAYDDVADEISLSGCFEDRDGQSPLGNVYVEANQIDVLTGDGDVDIWAGQTLENCLAGTPATPAVPANIQIGIMAGTAGASVTEDAYDFDQDRCPDKNELSDNQQQGGLRDPYNRWDYMNPTQDGQNRVDDILAVVNQYFIDEGNPSYTTETDRTAVIGANPWNLGPPNGQQRVDDILASVKSYFHDCSIP